MTKKNWAFRDLVAAISLLCTRLLFVVNTLTVFLSFRYIYKDFVRQLKAFPPSFCHFCACEMSPGWGHLITWMDPSVGHLNGILARVGGNLNNNFQKGQMPGGLPGGACWSFHLTDTLQRCGKFFSLAPPIPLGNFYPLAPPPPLRNFHWPSVGGGGEWIFSGITQYDSIE